MKRLTRLPCQLSVASSLVLAACGALAEQSDEYTPLGLANRPLQTSLQGASKGVVELGAAYTDEDNYTFGEYNGLYKDEVTPIGNLLWQDFDATDSYWQVSGLDLGLETREGKVVWGHPGRTRVTLGFDSQVQAGNNDGRTPFRGGNNQSLPEGWVSGFNTTQWTALDASLRKFDQDLKRDRFFAGFEQRINSRWSMDAGFSWEKKTGDQLTGAAIYTSSGSGDAVLLDQPIDYRTTEYDLGLSYSGDRLHFEGRLNYSEFDNQDDNALIWQNPYAYNNPVVGYPRGVGGLGLAPDNDQIGGRFTGQYRFSPRMRLQVDGSFAQASQDQDYLDYTVNPALVVPVPVPEKGFDGKVNNSTFNAKFLFQPLQKLDAQLFYKYRDRDYDTDRLGYQYVRGDGENQPGSAFTVYNTAHDYRSWIGGFEAGYRLPLRSRLSFEYDYEEVKRRNSAVEKDEEDRYTLAYRIQPWANFTARIEAAYADRAASTYQWAQSYYALLDTQLINDTPDTERYINHPLLFQYYVANREQTKVKTDLTYLPSDRWNLNLNLEWRDDDYDKSRLGLTKAEWYRAYFGASFVASRDLNLNLFAGYDEYKTDQASRTFRGGQEKNAFVAYPPFPQASDPNQDWDLHGEDTSYNVGAGLEWQVAEDIALSLDYRWVETRGEQNFSLPAGSNQTATDLPNVKTRLHQVEASGTWDVRENLSLKLEYQFYHYKSNDWAWDNVQPDTIGKVLTTGQGNPDDDINYVGASVIYRWQ